MVLVVSIIANWVQREALETEQVEDTTDQIVRDEDIQQALATFTVDQLYANVDVQGEIEQRLPSPAQPLAVPIAAATRDLATNVAERALASPQVQNLVSTAVGRAHEQFVSLIEDEGELLRPPAGRSHSNTGASSPTWPPASGSIRRRSLRSRPWCRSTRWPCGSG